MAEEEERQARCYSCRCFANGYTDTTTRRRFRVDVDIITLVLRYSNENTVASVYSKLVLSLSKYKKQY